ncbi:2-dehydropantoate 2-reductase [Luminiphilus syltensis NOR5-1B]|uniref:2-dehydropantoate 2-reductase n=1 Tax=Luminiphilus syltensis NOR5-1B TaxID=565045 RepID=B8KQN6_9GAMM|nr:2-dehydropantoate 2-reductase [Luminiphilus syltensis]EED34356.1 2-dehydropantoate 2-reductase [Luminiphilus syltensis NOR5-1B]
MTVHWHVAGAGAIGGYFAHQLRRYGCDVTLLTHRPSDGTRALTLETGENIETLLFPECPIGQSGRIDHLLITTKAFQVTEVFDALVSALAPDATVLIMVNGLSWLQSIETTRHPVQVCAGTTTTGCYRSNRDHIHRAGLGATQVGHLSAHKAMMEKPPPGIAELLRSTPDSYWSTDIRSILFNKLAINCAINPLTALYNVNNGGLLEGSLNDEFHSVIEETRTIFSALGYTGVATDLGQKAITVARQTAANTSSMCADFNARRRSELEDILGYLLDTLKPEAASEVDTPHLDQLLFALREKEAPYAKRPTP